MAVVYRNRNYLKRRTNETFGMSVFLWVQLFFFLAYTYEHNTRLNVVFFLLVTLTYLFFANYYWKAYKVFRAGVLGESRALKVLKTLPDTYHIFSNVTIDQKIGEEKKKSELDHLVVGPSGIFVIEVKNHYGKITGTADDHHWQQKKSGKQGGVIEGTLYNPTKQVSTHVFRLSKKLQHLGVHSWVQGVVFFSNISVDLDVRTKTIPVYHDDEKLLIFILKYKNDKPVTAEDQEKILEYIKSII